MAEYSSLKPSLRVLRAAEVTDVWFRADQVHLKPEYGVRYVTSVLEAVRRSLDRGGSISLTNSTEKDIRFVRFLITLHYFALIEVTFNFDL